jgi:hypothetical protein
MGPMTADGLALGTGTPLQLRDSAGVGLAGRRHRASSREGGGALPTLSGIVCGDPVKRAVWDVKGVKAWLRCRAVRAFTQLVVNAALPEWDDVW